MDAAARSPSAEPPLGLTAPDPCAPLEPQAHRSCSNGCCPIVCSGSLTLCFEALGEAGARPRATQYGGEEWGECWSWWGTPLSLFLFYAFFFFFLVVLVRDKKLFAKWKISSSPKRINFGKTETFYFAVSNHCKMLQRFPSGEAFPWIFP